MIRYKTHLHSFQPLLNLGPFFPLVLQLGSESKHVGNPKFKTTSEQPGLVPTPSPRSGGPGLGVPALPSEPVCSNPVLSQQTRAVSPNKAVPPVPRTLLLCNRVLCAKGKLMASDQHNSVLQ